MPTTHTDLSIRNHGDVTVVELLDRRLVDGVQIQRISEQLQGLVASMDSPRMVVSFAKVEFLSSSAVGALVALEKSIRNRKGRLGLAAINPDLQKVFALLKLDKMATVYKSANEAAADLKG